MCPSGYMDEFALHDEHRYAMVEMGVWTIRVIWVGEDDSREAIQPLHCLVYRDANRSRCRDLLKIKIAFPGKAR